MNIGGVDRAGVESVTSSPNGSNSSTLLNENITPELPIQRMVLTRSQPTEDSQHTRMADPDLERRVKRWMAWNALL